MVGSSACGSLRNPSQWQGQGVCVSSTISGTLGLHCQCPSEQWSPLYAFSPQPSDFNLARSALIRRELKRLLWSSPAISVIVQSLRPQSSSIYVGIGQSSPPLPDIKSLHYLRFLYHLLRAFYISLPLKRDCRFLPSYHMFLQLSSL